MLAAFPTPICHGAMNRVLQCPPGSRDSRRRLRRETVNTPLGSDAGRNLADSSRPASPYSRSGAIPPALQFREALAEPRSVMSVEYGTSEALSRAFAVTCGANSNGTASIARLHLIRYGMKQDLLRRQRGCDDRLPGPVMAAPASTPHPQSATAPPAPTRWEGRRTRQAPPEYPPRGRGG